MTAWESQAIALTVVVIEDFSYVYSRLQTVNVMPVTSAAVVPLFRIHSSEIQIGHNVVDEPWQQLTKLFKTVAILKCHHVLDKVSMIQLKSLFKMFILTDRNKQQ